MISSFKTFAAAIALMAFLTGCTGKQAAWRPSPAEIAAADHGAYLHNSRRQNVGNCRHIR